MGIINALVKQNTDVTTIKQHKKRRDGRKAHPSLIPNSRKVIPLKCFY
jgi:hypothetical protein